MAVSKIWVFLQILVIISIADASKLNVPRVLLPLFNEISVNFTLEATEGGCYRWSTTRIDVLQLVPLDIDFDLDCSSRTTIYAISKDTSRNIAVVLAEDVHSGQVLRCDVIVDVISSLSITTTTRELFMGEAPEAFEVRAYDDQENEFSSLEGVVFEWNVVGLGKNKDVTVLRFMTFKDSPYEAKWNIKEMEERNQRGNVALLEGVKTGSAKVTVKLPYPEYKHIPVQEVNLSVVANMMLMPAEVYMMVGDIIQIKVVHMNNGRLEEVVLPNLQYFLDTDDNNMAAVDKSTGELTALAEGRTSVHLHDLNVDETDLGVRLPTAIVNVVKPSYLLLNILPHRNWAILLSDHHDIIVEIYSENDHKMHVGPGVEIHTQVAELFNVEQRSLNGSWLTGWGVQEGVATVKATLESVIHPKRGRYTISPPITTEKELFIYPRITITPSEVILPWDPVIKPKYDIQLSASGGDGRFIWSSNNHSLGVVTQSGLVRTHAFGSFAVSVAMMKNHHNRESSRFHLLLPDRLEIVEYVMEAEIGSPIHLHVALYTKKPGSTEDIQIPFTRCQELAFKVKLSDTRFIENKTAVVKPVGVSCANIAIVGLAVGTTKVTVSYRNLEDTVTVSAYKPLKIVQPAGCELVLAVGSTLDVVFSGGPRPLLGRSSEHKHVISSADPDIVTATDVTQTRADAPEHELTAIQVLCHKLGEVEVTLSITNTAHLPNCINSESVAKVWVICGKPRAVFLQPRMKVADAQSCPMDLSAERIAVQSYQDIELAVIVKDQEGRRFIETSSLRFDWTLNPRDGGELAIANSVLRRKSTKSQQCGDETYQLITPKLATGSVDVTVTVVGYLKNVLSKNGVNPEWPEFVGDDEKGITLPPIQATLSLYLVDDTIVLPNSVSLYNFPSNKKSLTISHGSGYFELVLSADDIAEVNYMEGSRQIEIIPLKDGELKINVIDLCLVSRPAIVKVNVISVSIVRVEMSDKVEIGRCISCVVRVYDENDNLMVVPDPALLNLMLHVEDPIVTVEKQLEGAEEKAQLGEVHYVVTGVELGDTKIVFSIGSGDEVVESAPADIQVFPPLRLSPRNGTLIVGSLFQYTSKGGPQPDSNIEYTATSVNVVDVKGGGLVFGTSLGHTRIIAKAVGIHPSTGQRVLYSQDTVDLHVIPINGIKISTPLMRIQEGATIPVWATGLPDQISPLTLGALEPPIRFEWSLDDTSVAEISTIFSPIGIQYNATDRVVIRVKGIQSGRTKLTLKASVPGIATNYPKKTFVAFTSTIEIDVFEKLLLLEPEISSPSSILMPPYSTLQVKTNLDGAVKVLYSFPGEVVGSGGDDNKKSLSIPNPIISVSDKGLLSSTGVTGHTMLLITSVDEYGLKQTISVVVEVKQIHFMLLNVISNWQVLSDQPIITVPLGTEFQLKATFHDNVGNIFTSTATASLKVHSSRMDLVRIRQGADNTTFIVATKKPGMAVLKVWADDVSKTVDYVKVHVQQSTVPVVDFLTTGDVICLWTPVVDSTLKAGRWYSNDRNVMLVGHTDVAYVVGVKEGATLLSHSLLPAAPLRLNVVPVEKTIINPLPNTVLINIGVTSIPLVLKSARCKEKRSNLINKWQCKSSVSQSLSYIPFTCHIKFTNSTVPFDAGHIFGIKSAFNDELGSYTCDIFPAILSNPTISHIESPVTIWATVDGADAHVDPVQLPFVPAVHFEQEISLSEETQSGEFAVFGVPHVLKEVVVVPLDAKVLQVTHLKSGESDVLKYEVRLIAWDWKLADYSDALSVKVVSPKTHQEVKVHVKASHLFQKYGNECPVSHTDFFSSLFITYRGAAIVFVCVFVSLMCTYSFVAYFGANTVDVNVNPNGSLLNATACPPRCSIGGTPMFNTSGSPSRALQHEDPVYGSPNQFYNTSPEYRRNRRLM